MKEESDSYDFDEPYIDEERKHRSVLIKSLPPSIDKQTLTIHFQSRKNRGGDIQEVILLKNGSAVITFEEEQVAKSVQEKEQKLDGVVLSVEPYNLEAPKVQDLEVFSRVSAMIQPKMFNLSMTETHALLEKVREKTKIKVSKSPSDVYILSGSLPQIQKSRRLLQNILIQDKVCNGNGSSQRLSTKQTDNEHHVNGLEEVFEEENEAGISRRSLDDKMKITANPFSDSFGETSISDRDYSSYHYPPLNKELKTRKPPHSSLNKNTKCAEATTLNPKDKSENQDTNAKTIEVKCDCSISAEDKAIDATRKLHISYKEWHVFLTMYNEELLSIMSKFSVRIKAENNASVAVIEPVGECNKADLTTAVSKISVLYEEAKKKMISVCFVLADLENKEDDRKLRKLILEVKKTLRVVLEKTADRQSWKISGESEQVMKGMKMLEESVKLKLKEQEVDDEAMKSDSAEEIDIDNDTKSADDDEEEENDDDDYSQKLEHYLGKVKLSVYMGDITEEDCDAIVNAANENLYHGAGVARAIVSKGGSTIQDECIRIVQSKKKIKVGDAVVTHSGRLRCKMIIHAVGPNWRETQGEEGKSLLNKVCRESLIQAQKYNFRSIAFPAISSGIFSFPKTLCAQVMFDVAEEYSKRVSSSGTFIVHDIRFVNNDVKTVKIFRREFKERYGIGYLISEDKQDATSRESSNLSQISRTFPNVGSSTTAEIEKAGPPVYSAVPSFSEQAGRREGHPRKQNDQSHSPDNVIPLRSSIDFSFNTKERKITKHRQQPVNDTTSDVLPKGEESRFKSYSNHPVKYSSFHGGARPKRPKSSYVKKETKHEDLQPSSFSNDKTKDKRPKCPICLEQFTQPKTLPNCKHTFCKVCLENALQQSPWCPYCKDPQPSSKHSQLNHDPYIAMQSSLPDSLSLNPRLFHQPFSQTFGTMDHEYRRKPRELDRENHAFHSYSLDGYSQEQSVQMQQRRQPLGSMMYRQEPLTLSGYEQYGTIVIQYSFRGGIQGPCHPNPGQRYDGTCRSAYLPDCREGREVLKLLRKAFDAGLIFKIGRSMTSRMDNQIIWADIPHKTSTSGGSANYGYPDPTYLADVTRLLQEALSSNRS